MVLINEALVFPNTELIDNPPEGLMCLDACKCIGDDFCTIDL